MERGWRRLAVVATGAAALVIAPLVHAEQEAPSASRLSPAKYHEVSSGVVRIEVRGCNPDRVMAQGTGFLVGRQLVMTARHVLEGPAFHRCHYVRAVVGGRSYRGALIKYWRTANTKDSKRVDIATMKLNRPSAGHVFSFATTSPRLGTTIAAIGFPAGYAMTLSQGRLSEKGTLRGIPTLVVRGITAQGASGSAMLDPSGRAVGILQKTLGSVGATSGAVVGDVFFGVNLVRWWGSGIVRDLCRVYPAGGIPGCSSAAPKPPTTPTPPPSIPPPPTAPPAVPLGKYCGFTDSGGGICFDVGTGASGQYMTNATFEQTTVCQPERAFRITVTLTAQQVRLGSDLTFTYDPTGSLAGSRLTGTVDTQGGARGALTLRYVFDRDGVRYTCAQNTSWSARVQR